MSALTCDAEHRYWLEDMVGQRQRIPGVTEVLRAAGYVDDRWYTPEATHRGTVVHVATALWDRGQQTLPGLPDECRGYLESWQKFLADREPEFLSIERANWSPMYMYAGRWDRRALMSDGHWLIDIKTGNPVWWHGVQLAALAELCDRELVGRMAVYLQAVGWAPIVRIYTDPSDWDVFYHALQVWRVRYNHGLLRESTNGAG